MRRIGRTLGSWTLSAILLLSGMPAGAVYAEATESGNQAEGAYIEQQTETTAGESSVAEEQRADEVEALEAGEEDLRENGAIEENARGQAAPDNGPLVSLAAADMIVKAPCRLLADDKRVSITEVQAADRTAFEACISAAGSGAGYRIMRNGSEAGFPLKAGDIVEIVQDETVAVSYEITINAVYKKPATASDSYNTTTMAPSAAVDGDTTTRWGTRQTGSQWLQVDLGKKQKLASYAVCGFNEHIKEYQIQYSNTGNGDWISAATGGPTSSSRGTWQEGSFEEQIEARYVRFFASSVADAKATSIMELELHTAPTDELSLEVLLDDAKPERVSVERQGSVSDLQYIEEQNRFVGELSKGTYRVLINGKDCGKEIVVSGNVEDTIRAYTVKFAEKTAGNMELPIWAKNRMTNEKIESGAPVLSGTEVEFEIGAAGDIEAVWSGITGSGLTASVVYDRVIPEVGCEIQAASVAYKVELRIFIDDLPSTLPAALKQADGTAHTLTNGQGIYTATLEQGSYSLWLSGRDTGETVTVSQTGNDREIRFYTVRFAEKTTGMESVPIQTTQTNGALVISGTAVEFSVALSGKGMIPAWSNNFFQPRNTVVYDRPVPEITCEVKDRVVVSQGKTVTSSHKSVNNYPLEYINDGDTKTRWACHSVKVDASTPAGEVWVTVDLGAKTAFNQFYSKPGKSQTNHVKLSYSDDNQSWTTITERTDAYGETQQQDFMCSFPMVEARYFRLTFLEIGSVYPGIYELQLMQVPQYPVQVSARVGDSAPDSVQMGEQGAYYELQKQGDDFVTELPAGTYQVYVEGGETGVRAEVQAQMKPLDLQLYRVVFSDTATGVRPLSVKASAGERVLSDGDPVMAGTEVVFEIDLSPFEQAVWSGAADTRGKKITIMYNKILPRLQCEVIAVEAVEAAVSVLVNDKPPELAAIVLKNDQNTFELTKGEDGDFGGIIASGTYRLWISDRETRYTVEISPEQRRANCLFYTVDFEPYAKGVRTEVTAADIESGVSLKSGDWIEKGQSVRFSAEPPEGMLITWSGAGSSEESVIDVLYDGVKPSMVCEIGEEVLISRNKPASANVESAPDSLLESLNDDDAATVWKPMPGGQSRDVEIVLDLQRPQAFNRVDWILEQKSGSETVVFISDDNTAWTQIAAREASAENGMALEPQRARYVKLCFRDADDGFAVRELRILNSEIVKRMLDVRERLSLPKNVMNYDFNLITAVDDLIVTWSSDTPAVIRIEGGVARVTRPEDADKKVILTAVVSQGRLNTEKELEITVEKKPTGGGGGGGGGASGGGGGGGRYSGGALSSGTLGTVEEIQGGAERQTPTERYEDVGSGHWAYTYIQTLSEMGIVNGKAERIFEPDAMVTREEFAKMLAEALELRPGQEELMFQDVSQNAWYHPYVSALVEHDIIRGVTDQLFGVGEWMIRQDLAVILDRASQKEIPENSVWQPFADQSEISDYAVESVKRMRQAGIISGDENGAFRPFGTTTRAEACKVIYGLIS